MRVTRSGLAIASAVLLMVGASVVACSSASPRNNSSTGGAGGEEDTGGSKGSTGGKSGGTGGKTATGGSSGGDTGGATGSTRGSTGSTGGSSGGDTGGAGGSTGGAGGGGDTGGAGGGSTGGAGGSTGTGGATGGALLSCWADSKVIKICHQLENACENCGLSSPKACNTGTHTPKAVCDCFELVDKAYAGMATDAECEAFAAANKCTVDNVATTGNICGSLDCEAPACKCQGADCGDEKNRGKTCAADQHWGDSSGCMKWLAKCPCSNGK